MNDALYNHLGALGFTEEALADRVRAYLRSAITGAGGTPGTEATEEDLWKHLGVLLGASSTNVNQIQMEWCVFRGSTGSTWNDLMRNLP